MKSPRDTMSKISLAVFALVTASCLLSFVRRDKNPSPPLLVHCAAGLRMPVEELAQQFRTETGIEVQLQFGGSQQLLAGITVTKRGDLFIPSDDSYLVAAEERGDVAETLPLARMNLTVAVQKGNPKQIAALADLLRADVRIALPNPDTAASGKLARAALAASWEPLAQKAIVMKPTVNEIANDLKLGVVDAGIVFDAVASQYPELETVPIPELENIRANVTAGVLTASTQPANALRFARFLATDRGAKVFQQHGYEQQGLRWAK